MAAVVGLPDNLKADREEVELRQSQAELARMNFNDGGERDRPELNGPGQAGGHSSAGG